MSATSPGSIFPCAGLVIGEGVPPTVGVVPGVGVGVTPIVGVGVGGWVGVGKGVGVMPPGLVGTGVKLTGVGMPPEPLFCVGVAVKPGCGVPGAGVMPLLPNGPAATMTGSLTTRLVASSYTTTRC